jgi:hypothetical protein
MLLKNLWTATPRLCRTRSYVICKRCGWYRWWQKVLQRTIGACGVTAVQIVLRLAEPVEVYICEAIVWCALAP